MRHRPRLLGGHVLVALALWVGGCEPAGRYRAGPPAAGRSASGAQGSNPIVAPAVEPKKANESKPLSTDLAWQPASSRQVAPEIRIEFVHEGTNQKAWNELKQFWNLVETPNPTTPAALVGLPPLQAAAIAAASRPASMTRVVKIKVPLGLDDPTPHVPPSNPPTVGKWQLGKELFFDDTYLQAAAILAQSCASCHKPSSSYTEAMMPRGGSLRTPTLINSVYNAYQFWDGRASALEEVVQRTLDDERAAPNLTPERRHVWNGVVERLRANPKYQARFLEVFGTPPTQDAVGKALATYLRTILSGNSIHDRAHHAQARKPLDAKAYEKYLDPAALKLFERESEPPAAVAKDVFTGYTLFQGKGRCVHCHSSANFTDNRFHNLGVGDSNREPLPGSETGRFAVLPIGLKDPRMIGAYKTPTLRGLPRTKIYFHDGTQNDLFSVVAFHVRGGLWNPSLDPELRDEQDPNKPRNLRLSEAEVQDLVLFLQALDGDPIDPVVADPKTWPPGRASKP